MRLTSLLLSVLLITFVSQLPINSLKFDIDYVNNQFVMDGKPFRYISGSVHYFRVHPDDWRDRLLKLKMAGFNAVQTYVEWSSHEREPGQYDFSGPFDLERFISLAGELGLYVILRPGPYICAERDMGGLPYWILKYYPKIRLRTSDEDFLALVFKWLEFVLLPKIRPLLYENGGPVIMVQVENEYGIYEACDYKYTSFLRDVFRKNLDVVLFTTDPAMPKVLRCGKIPGVYATVDFGPPTKAKVAFGVQRLFEPQGPLVNSEYYSGWLDSWGSPHNTKTPQEIADGLDEILSMNASVNMYVFHGGTNFGLSSGAEKNPFYRANPTSYDYDAPLSEAGDPTEKYVAIKKVIEKHAPTVPFPVPPPTPKGAYGKVFLEPTIDLFQLRDQINSSYAKWPLTFEALSLSSGVVLYETKLPCNTSDPSRMDIFDLRDRGHVFIEGHFVGHVSRGQELFTLPVVGQKNDQLIIVIESLGRINVGNSLNDFKGLTMNVTIDGSKLSNWKMTPVDLTKCPLQARSTAELRRRRKPKASDGGRMTFYGGTFTIPAKRTEPRNTFLSLEGWRKGIAYINGFNLGRYWSVEGPQKTLFVPRSVLRQGSNEVTILELESAPEGSSSSMFVTFTNKPIINGTIPGC